MGNKKIKFDLGEIEDPGLATLDNSKLEPLDLQPLSTAKKGIDAQKALGVAGIVGSGLMESINNITGALNGADITAYNNNINNSTSRIGANSYDELMAEQASQGLLGRVTAKNLGATSLKDDVLNSFKNAASGAMSGMSAGPWGMLAGAVTNQASSLIGSGLKNAKIRNQAEQLTARNAEANVTRAANLNARAENIAMNNANLAMANYSAFGGNVTTNGADFPTGLRHFDAGGSHESNPFEGVQIGVDPQGVPNLVEEGETMFNNYVFSNRINITEDIRKAYKLGGSVKTFADASKYLAKESEETPNDPITRRTQEKMLSRLQEEQEAIKQRMAQEEAQANQDAQLQAMSAAGVTPELMQQGMQEEMPLEEEMMPQEMPEQMPEQEFAYGGNLFGGVTGSSYVNDVDDIDLQYLDAPNPNSIVNNSTGNFTAAPNDMELLVNSPQYVADHPEEVKKYKASNPSATIANPAPTTSSSKPDPKFAPTWMRYAPVFGGAVGLGMALKKPDYSRANAVEAFANTNLDSTYTPVDFDPIGNYLQYNPLDRNYYLEQLNQKAGATRNTIINNSNGNRASAVAGLLAAGYNDQMAVGNLARQAEEYNQAQREKVEAFNRGTNQYNSEMGLKAQMANQEARMRAKQFNKELGFKATLAANEMRDKLDMQRSAAISANIGNIFNNLGAIGRENYAMNQNKMLQSSGYYGTLPFKPYGWSDSEWKAYQKYNKEQIAREDRIRKETREEREANNKQMQTMQKSIDELTAYKNKTTYENNKRNAAIIQQAASIGYDFDPNTFAFTQRPKQKTTNKKGK